jgi:hypothetical protein
MKSPCGERKSRNIIGSGCHKFINILQKMGPLKKGIHFYHDFSHNDFLANNVNIE